MKTIYFRHTFKCPECGELTVIVSKFEMAEKAFLHITCGHCLRIMSVSCAIDTKFAMGTMKELNADVLQEDAYEWSQKTFGTNRGPEGALNHLKRECKEAIDSPGDIMEYGDMWLLLSDAASSAGFTMTQVLYAASLKLVINKNREWGEIDAEGVCEHIEESEK